MLIIFTVSENGYENLVDRNFYYITFFIFLFKVCTLPFL